MNAVVAPEDLSLWMAGDIVQDSTPLGWEGLKLRRYRTPPQEVVLPRLTDFGLVSYVERETVNWRGDGGAWESRRIGPGMVSVLTRAEVSHWRWSKPIEAIHVYLPFEALASVAAEVFERDIADIELKNVLSADDAVLAEAASRLCAETRVGGLGGRLYVQALRCQICVHIIRTYATVAFREPRFHGGLSRAQCRILTEFIEENIERNISLAELASLVQLSVFHLSRKFRQEFGCPPYAYVLRQRLEHATRQLRNGNLPLKFVAAKSGFSDQSHMTRLFRRAFGATPAQYRKQASDR